MNKDHTTYAQLVADYRGNTSNAHPIFAPILKAIEATGKPPVRRYCSEVTLLQLLTPIKSLQMTGEQVADVLYELQGALANSLYVNHGNVNLENVADRMLIECKAFAADVEQQMHDDSKKARTV